MHCAHNAPTLAADGLAQHHRAPGVELLELLTPTTNPRTLDEIVRAARRATSRFVALPADGVEWLVRFVAWRGLAGASLAYLAMKMDLRAGTEREKCRTLRRVLTVLARERVLVVLGARGKGGGTVLTLAKGREVDKAALARAALEASGEQVAKRGLLRTVAQAMRLTLPNLRNLHPRQLEILRRVAAKIGQAWPIKLPVIPKEDSSSTRPAAQPALPVETPTAASVEPEQALVADPEPPEPTPAPRPEPIPPSAPVLPNQEEGLQAGPQRGPGGRARLPIVSDLLAYLAEQTRQQRAPRNSPFLADFPGRQRAKDESG
jgi:hypothetical protein